MRFDADAYLASLTPPTLTVGGRTFVGRHLSADEALRHLAALTALEAEGVTDADAGATVEAFIASLFPEPITPMIPTPRWRVWRRRPPPPLRVVDLFRALPLAAQIAAVQGFSEVLASSMLPRGGTPGPTTSDAPSATALRTRRPPSGSPSSSPASSPGTAPPPGMTPRATARGTG